MVSEAGVVWPGCVDSGTSSRALPAVDGARAPRSDERSPASAAAPPSCARRSCVARTPRPPVQHSQVEAPLPCHRRRHADVVFLVVAVPVFARPLPQLDTAVDECEPGVGDNGIVTS